MFSRSNILICLLLIVLIIFVWQFILYINQQRTDNELIIYGNVDVRNVALAFRVSGRLAKMNFEEGDHVNRGDILAVLDMDTFLANMSMANAELAQALANQYNAASTFERRNKLTTNGAVSQAAFIDAVANFKAKKALVLLQQANLDKATIALNDTKMLSPNNAVVLTRVREPGSIVDPTQIVYTLTLDNPVWVRTYIEEPYLGRIFPGQKAEIFTDSNPDQPYQGSIGFISPEAEFTPKNVQTTQLRTDLVYRLRIIVQNPDRGLRQGMPVTIRIDLNKDSNGRTG